MWVDHTGGGPPPLSPRALVLVEFRDGAKTAAAERVDYWGPNWQWDRRFPGDSEIVAYKEMK